MEQYSLATSLQLGKILACDSNPINSLCFSDDGTLLIAGTTESLSCFNLHSPNQRAKILDKPHGFRLVKFLHHREHALSTNSHGKFPVLALSDINVPISVQFFEGHVKRITSIDVNPGMHCFLSSGLDCHLKIWDPRDQRAVFSAYMDACQYNICKYDPSGVVIALAQTIGGRGWIKFYDTRKLENCSYFQSKISSEGIQDIDFADDGTKLLATTKKNQCYLLDAINLKHLDCLQQFTTPIISRFAPDSSSFALAADNVLQTYWNNCTPASVLSGNFDAINSLEWNRRFHVLAASCSVVCLYTPF